MPVDRGEIDAQLREIGEGERWWEQREFRALPHILQSGERLRALVTGKLLGPRRPRLLPAPRWLVVATDRRLVCIRMERFGRQQVEVDLDRIVEIRHASRPRSYRVVIQTPHQLLRLRIRREDAFRFIGALSPDGTGPALPGTGRAFKRYALPAVVPSLLGAFSRLTGAVGADPATQAQLARVEGTVERLEAEVERLRQQVDFLESLVQSSQRGLLAAHPRSDSDA